MEKDDRFFLAALAAALLLMVLLATGPAAGPGAAGPGPALAGRPRDVDTVLIRRLILEGRLSDHEALYYRRR